MAAVVPRDRPAETGPNTEFHGRLFQEQKFGFQQAMNDMTQAVRKTFDEMGQGLKAIVQQHVN